MEIKATGHINNFVIEYGNIPLSAFEGVKGSVWNSILINK